MSVAGYTGEINRLVEVLLERVKEYYGERLVSFVLFGSVARGKQRPDSDIDCLIITRKLPRGRIRRVSEFSGNVEKTLERRIRELEKKGIHINLSPVFKTVEEVEKGSPLFLDMVYDAVILYDRDGFFRGYLDRLRERLARLGARRIVRGNAWYWVLKPDYRYGDVIEL